jgi:glycolate oxidase
MPDQTAIIRALKEIVGEKHVLTSPEELTVYAYDATAPAADYLPLAVVTPGCTEEVAGVVRLANEQKIPVIARGSGTGLNRAVVPLSESILITFSRMNRILEIDAANLTALVEPGLLTAELAKAVEAQGLFYPPDPASMSVTTIGGNVGTNAGGLRGLKYGVTGDYVMGLEAVLASGEVIWMGNKCKKDVAGYDLTPLFVGAEGTLGIVTKILVRLLPLPEATRTMVAFFSDIQPAAQVVADIIAAKIIPVTLEILDDDTLRAVDQYARLNLPEAGAMLLIEVDGPAAALDAEIELIAAICRRNQATELAIARDAEEAARLKTARRMALAALARLRPTVIMADLAVPRNRIPDMVRRIREICAHHRVQMAVFGHAGDGNLHPNAITDARDTEEMARVEQAFDDIMLAALDLGGTIAAEHGIGLKKRHLLPHMVGPTSMSVMASIKKALDPNNILNPGKVLEL